MAQVNINRKVEDPFYRYKMPRLVAKVEGRGNGIKTLVVNMLDIAKSLQVPPSYPTKYLGIELGAQVILDEKNERYIVNGAHENAKLQNVLYDFIERYLLCPNCDNPETYMVAHSKKEKIKLVCKACGNQSPINHIHRLNTYIIKNPPTNVFDERTEEPVVLAKNDEFQPPKETIECEWLTDTSQAAMRERMATLTQHAAELTVNCDLEKPLEQRLQMLVDFSKIVLSDDSPDYVKIVHESKRLDLGEKAIVAVFEALFTDECIPRQINLHKDLLLRLADSSRAQRNLIGCIEAVFARCPEMDSIVILQAFKLLYHHDIVCEDVFLACNDKKSRHLKDPVLATKFRDVVEPFINWLKTAEEESSEDSEEIIFEAPAAEASDILKSASRHGVITAADSEDDLNIDDI